MASITNIILLSAIPGLMFFIFQVGDFSFRFSWQLVSIWLAGVAFAAILSSWFWRIFFLLALGQAAFDTMLNGAILTSYITLMMIAIFLGAAERFSRMSLDHIMDAMCVAGSLLSLWVIGQRLGLIPYFNIGISGAGPFNGNAAGVFLALCVPAFCRKAHSSWLLAHGWLRKLRLWQLLPVVGVGIYLCRSTTGMIAALAGLGAWALVSRVGILWTGAGALMACMIFGLFLWKGDPSPNILPVGRWPVWERAIRSFEAAPFGRGLGSFAQVFPRMTVGDDRIYHRGAAMMHAHNEYLQTGFEMGLQAMAVVMGYPVWIGVMAWRKRKRLADTGRIAVAGIAALAVSCLGWHTFHIAPLAVLGSAWLGMGHRALRDG